MANVTASYFQKRFSFESWKYLLDLCLDDCRTLVLTGPGIHPQFYHKLHALDTYLWGGLIKNKGGVGLFQISQKERLFISHEPSTLGGNLSVTPLLVPSKKGLPLPFNKRAQLDTQLKGGHTNLFFKLPGCFLSPNAD